MLEIVRDLARAHGKAWATEAGLRRELYRRTGYLCGERSIGRRIAALVAEGLMGHERVMPNARLITGERTLSGGQHNWTITRAHRRHAERRDRERARQERHRAERAEAAKERAAAEQRAREVARASAPSYTAIALALRPVPLAPTQAPAVVDDAPSSYVARAVDQLGALDALEALWAAEAKRKPPD